MLSLIKDIKTNELLANKLHSPFMFLKKTDEFFLNENHTNYKHIHVNSLLHKNSLSLNLYF